MLYLHACLPWSIDLPVGCILTLTATETTHFSKGMPKPWDMGQMRVLFLLRHELSHLMSQHGEHVPVLKRAACTSLRFSVCTLGS